LNRVAKALEKEKIRDVGRLIQQVMRTAQSRNKECQATLETVLGMLQYNELSKTKEVLDRRKGLIASFTGYTCC